MNTYGYFVSYNSIIGVAGSEDSVVGYPKGPIVRGVGTKFHCQRQRLAVHRRDGFVGGKRRWPACEKIERLIDQCYKNACSSAQFNIIFKILPILLRQRSFLKLG